MNVKTTADLIQQDDVDPYSPIIQLTNRVLRYEKKWFIESSRLFVWTHLFFTLQFT